MAAPASGSLRSLPAVGELPSPWETWTLIGLFRHRERQYWVRDIIQTRLQGDTSRLARLGSMGHPDGVKQSGSVPGLPEWEYYFHGIGCCLTHKVTGEEIDVDFWADTAEHFDLFFYTNYLKSLRQPEPVEQRLRELHPSLRAGRLHHQPAVHLLPDVHADRRAPRGQGIGTRRRPGWVYRREYGSPGGWVRPPVRPPARPSHGQSEAGEWLVGRSAQSWAEPTDHPTGAENRDHQGRQYGPACRGLLSLRPDRSAGFAACSPSGSSPRVGVYDRPTNQTDPLWADRLGWMVGRTARRGCGPTIQLRRSALDGWSGAVRCVACRPLTRELPATGVAGTVGHPVRYGPAAGDGTKPPGG